jgi:serine/threonine protein kinase/Flp pilus assembly protein TadD
MGQQEQSFPEGRHPRRVGPLLDDQVRRWRQGERVPVEDYLDRHAWLADDPEDLLDLVFNEALLREEQGEDPQADEYIRRFPQFHSLIQDQFDVFKALRPDGLHCPGRAGHTTWAAPARETDHALDRTGVEKSGATPPVGATPSTAGWPEVPGYEIVGELGRGGMGVVYQARQKGLNRLVALKVVLGGAHAGPEERARFRREAEAVACLQHPHIVQIHEIGEAGGIPFFSLELVDGGSLAERLNGTPLPPHRAAALVETLARAIHAAHQRGIIHRDLKPANILLQRKPEISSAQSAIRNPQSEKKSTEPVSDFGFRISDFEPKITDFGLAKRLDTSPRQTGSGAVMGTPSYMAPEQARGQGRDAGPPADVYALGALLYELLTGRPPFKGPTPVDTLLQVLSQEPVPARRLQPQVPRDLETVCLKCLHKDPRKRYPSALELADDLARFAQGEPVRARPIPAWERALKWARRRPAAAALAAVVAAAVVGLLAGGWWYNARLQDERDRAAANAAEARRAQRRADKNARLARDHLTIFKEMLSSAYKDLEGRPGLAEVRAKLLRSAQKALRRVTQGPAASGEVNHLVMWTCFDLGDLFQGVGQMTEAEQQYRQAHRIAAALAGTNPDDPQAQRDLSVSYTKLGDVYQERGKTAAARDAYRKALTIDRALAGAGPHDPQAQRDLCVSYIRLGDVSLDLGEFAAARDVYRQALTIQEELARTDRGPQARRDLSVAYEKLGDAFLGLGRFRDARDTFRKVMALRRPLAKADRQSREAQRDLSVAFGKLGNVSLELGDTLAAREAYRQGLDIDERLVQADPGNLRALQDLAISHQKMGEVSLELGDTRAARLDLEETLKLRREFARKDKDNPRARHDLALAEEKVGDLEREVGNLLAARNAYGRAVELAAPLARAESPTAAIRDDLAFFYLSLGDVRRELGEAGAAREAYENARKVLKPLVRAKRDSLGAKIGLAMVQARQGGHREAAEAAKEVRRLARDNPDLLYKAACVYALSARAAAEANGPTNRASEGYAAGALQALRAAIAKGYRRVNLLKKDRDFDFLRDRRDFNELVAGLEVRVEKERRAAAKQ